MAFRTFLTAVRSRDRSAALWARRTSFCLARFFADLMLATVSVGVPRRKGRYYSEPPNPSQAERPRPPSAAAAPPRDRLLRSTGVVGSMTLLSRISGLVRDKALSYWFGADVAMDAFIVAFKIPNLLRRLFAEGAYSAAFVP